MLAFITVGSTKFDSLVQSVFTQPVLSAFRSRGYVNVVLQCGNSTFDQANLIKHDEIQHTERDGVNIEFWRFKPSLEDDFKKADLVIGHAGSGTILDVLRLPKPLIVVPNPTLLGNHQEDLAEALAGLGHIITTNVAGLPKAIETFDASKLEPFPPMDRTRITKIFDEEIESLRN